MEEIIIIPSNTCPALHADNTASRFRVTFDNTRNFPGEWEVALMEITYVNSMHNVVNESYTVEELPKKEKGKPLADFANFQLTKDVGVFSYPKDQDLHMRYHKKTNRYELLKTAPAGENRESYKINIKVGKRLGFLAPNYTNRTGEDDIILDENATHVMAPYPPLASDEEVTIAVVRVKKPPAPLEKWTHKLREGYYRTLPLLIKELNGTNTNTMEKFKDILTGQDFVQFQIPKQPEPSKALDKVKWTFDDHTQQVAVAIKEGYCIHFANGLEEILGFTEKTLPAGFHLSKYPCLMNRGVYNFFIYCDIIEPVQVGNVRTSLLRMVDVPTGNEWGSVACRVINTPIFVPLNASSINSILFEIRDDTGQLIKFSNAKTTVTLKFQPCKV